jgi:hypothetical protein
LDGVLMTEPADCLSPSDRDLPTFYKENPKLVNRVSLFSEAYSHPLAEYTSPGSEGGS